MASPSGGIIPQKMKFVNLALPHPWHTHLLPEGVECPHDRTVVDGAVERGGSRAVFLRQLCHLLHVLRVGHSRIDGPSPAKKRRQHLRHPSKSGVCNNRDYFNVFGY